MIDYQEKFKQKLIFILLIILIVPFIIIFYSGQKSDSDIKQARTVSIKQTTTLGLRGTIQDIKLSKDSKTAYVAAASRGVYIIDIKEPLKPKLISQFKYFKNSYDKSRSIKLAEDKNILFVRDAQAGIYSIDIANPSEPKLLATYKSQVPIYKFCISNKKDKIYISDADGIKIADITNTDTIKVITTYDKKRKYFDMVEVKENILYLLAAYGIDIVNTGFSQGPKLVGNYLTSGDAKKITVSKNKTRAFISSGYNGVEIVNIANKLNPKPLGIYKTSHMVKKAIVSKNAQTLYISNLNDIIDIVDITNPDDAKLLQEININPTKKAQIGSMALSIDEDKLFVANGIGGFKVIHLR